jgi:hypothetical protein
MYLFLWLAELAEACNPPDVEVGSKLKPWTWEK